MTSHLAMKMICIYIWIPSVTLPRDSGRRVRCADTKKKRARSPCPCRCYALCFPCMRCCWCPHQTRAERERERERSHLLSLFLMLQARMQGDWSKHERIKGIPRTQMLPVGTYGVHPSRLTRRVIASASLSFNCSVHVAFLSDQDQPSLLRECGWLL